MIANPTFSLGEVYKMLQWFSKVFYYRVNETKSNILDLTIDGITRSLLTQQFPFAWADASISYLGIQLTKSVKSLFQANYTPLYTKVQQDLTQKHEFSWAGRLAAFKMTVLPQLLYLFRTLPILLPQSYFKSLQSSFNTYIWQGKTPRCAFHKLVKHRSAGGSRPGI